MRKCVALTFDDGPGPDTNRLLDILAAKKVQATFFVVGQMVAAHPALVTREAAEGHVVGNHTWSHADLRKLDPDALAAQIGRAATQIVQATGVQPTLLRPPSGWLTPALDHTMAINGYASILWSVDTEDWKNRDAATTTARAVDGVQPGAIILMHDIRPTTVDAIGGIIDQLRAKGYTLVTVPQLLGSPPIPGHRYYSR